METQRLPLPPFTLETALQKVQAAEDAWNTKDPEKVSLAYTLDTEWRNRTEFINGREEVKQFLTRKWEKELDYKLKKEWWGFRENRMAVRFEYEWHDRQWYRSYGNKPCNQLQTSKNLSYCKTLKMLLKKILKQNILPVILPTL